MIRILFICTGNVHRSVLAERLLAAKLPPDSAVLPVSAGTKARPRSGMESATQVALERLGGDGSAFATRALTAQFVTEAALVLGLAREHREAAVRLAPTAMRRCFTLKEFVRLADRGTDVARGSFTEVVAAAAARRGIAGPVPTDEDDVADPWGGHPRVLFRCACEIAAEVSKLVRLLDRDDGAAL
jgi:protein-tyrosine phosphatase